MNFFGHIKDAIFVPSAYKELAGQKIAISLLYLVLLVFLVTLPVHIYLGMEMMSGIDGIGDEAQRKIPDFLLSDGELKVEGEMPIVIDEPTPGTGTSSSSPSGDIYIVVDTTGRMDEKSLLYHTNGIFIGKDRLVQKDNFRNQTIYFKDFKDATFTKADMMAYIPWLKTFSILFMILGPITVCIFKLIQALLLGLVAWLVAQGMKVELAYARGLNIAIYALTLPVLLDGIMEGFWPDFPMFFLVYYTIAMVYLVLGVRAYSDDELMI